METLVTLMAITLILLSVVLVAFLILLIIVLFMIRKTLFKIQKAVDDVEKTALRSLIPLMGIKNMFSDLEGFINSLRAWGKVLTGKRSSRVDKMVKEKDID